MESRHGRSVETLAYARDFAISPVRRLLCLAASSMVYTPAADVPGVAAGADVGAGATVDELELSWSAMALRRPPAFWMAALDACKR